MVIGLLIANKLNLVLHMICNSANLRLTTGLANNEEIGHSFIYFTEVEGNDILPFFILDCGDYGFDDLRTLS